MKKKREENLHSGYIPEEQEAIGRRNIRSEEQCITQRWWH